MLFKFNNWGYFSLFINKSVDRKTAFPHAHKGWLLTLHPIYVVSIYYSISMSLPILFDKEGGKVHLH